MPTQDDILHQESMMEQHRRNIQLYLNQIAQYGGEMYAPVALLNGLKHSRSEIALIKLTLRDWGQDVEDLRIDMAPSDSLTATVAEVPPPTDLLTYDIVQQPWFVERPPLIERMPREDVQPWLDQMRVLLLTVNDHEFFAVGRLLQPLAPYQRVRQVAVDNESYYLGRYGVYNTVVMKSRMGTTGPGAALLSISKAQDLWKPSATIAVGVAFGMDRHKQQLGDVLIASEIIPYNPIRAGAKLIERGQHLAADVALYNRFDNTYDWEFTRPDDQPVRTHRGAVLSGEELIDNAARKEELRRRFPEAIGGEMEGTGLSAASFYERRPWILIKAICDWADGTKSGDHQPLAAAAAASLVHHVLSDPDTLGKG